MRRGQRIRELMAREQIPSLRQLATRVGVHYSTLSLVTRGLINPSGHIRDVFTDEFPTYSPDWLFPREPDGGRREPVEVAS